MRRAVQSSAGASPSGAVVDRRRLLQAGLLGGALLALDAVVPRRAAAAPYGALLPPDGNGLQLPPGFSSRVVARSNQAVTGSTYKWHKAPDGGATFAAGGGWIYVSNCEMSDGRGGASMIRFLSDGTVAEARSILAGTNRNCAGGATPWGTWLSCEEVSDGRVWEADPLGVAPAVSRPAMGRFNHEGAAVDAANRTVYMTEDAVAGLFYRFRYDRPNDLSTGVLEAARVQGGVVTGWIRIADPSGTSTPTRKQAASGATKFNGGEGIWFSPGSGGIVYFTTKGDDRVWAHNTSSGTMTVVYDWSTSANPVLRGVDNVAVLGGRVFVCEDQSTLDASLREDPEICMIEPAGGGSPGSVSAVVRAVGHRSSELTGVAFAPSGDRMYFSSQRGTTGTVGGGVTFEVRGPFLG